ncbi:hypothetical protein Tco_0818001 [Tanacetum coccineum]
MKSEDVGVKNSILTPRGERKRRIHRISKIRKEDSDNICEGKNRFICVEYKWTAPRCSSCKVFGHVLDECPKKSVSEIQAVRGVQVENDDYLGTNRGNTKMVEKGGDSGMLVRSAGTRGKKKQAGLSRQEVNNSNLIGALNSVENDDYLGTNGGNSKLAEKGGDSGVPLNKVDSSPVNSDSESDVEVAYDETAQFMANEGTNDASLYEDEDYNIYNTYDIEGLTKKELAMCDMMDINLRGRSRR